MYKEQAVQLALKSPGMKKLTLMKLFGWGDKMSSVEAMSAYHPRSRESQVRNQRQVADRPQQFRGAIPQDHSVKDG